jgi:hypothetical protein
VTTLGGRAALPLRFSFHLVHRKYRTVCYFGDWCPLIPDFSCTVCSWPSTRYSSRRCSPRPRSSAGLSFTGNTGFDGAHVDLKSRRVVLLTGGSPAPHTLPREGKNGSAFTFRDRLVGGIGWDQWPLFVSMHAVILSGFESCSCGARVWSWRVFSLDPWTSLSIDLWERVVGVGDQGVQPRYG